LSKACLKASGVEMSGWGAPSRTTTPVTVPTEVGNAARNYEAKLCQFGNCGFRQDDEVSHLAILDALAQRARRTEIQIQLFAALVFEFGAKCRYH
jgi:hypothetical protein